MNIDNLQGPNNEPKSFVKCDLSNEQPTLCPYPSVRPDHFEPAGVIADRVIKRTDYLSQQNDMLKTLWMAERTRRLDMMGHNDIRFAEYSPSELDEAREDAKAWRIEKQASGGIKAERQS